MLTVFFNRSYATNAHVIGMLRDNPDGEKVRIVGTHADPDSPVLAACDEAYPEPDDSVTGADYVRWALQFCTDHDVDVFIPRLHMADLTAAAGLFARCGVTLLASPAAAVRVFEDKAAGYAAAELLGLPTPPHHVITTAPALAAAVEDLGGVTDRVCIKPVTGVGAEGFRVLSRAPMTLAGLLGPLTPTVAMGQVYETLRAATAAGVVVPPLLVLPFLTGPEVSIDTLADADGRTIASIGRVKGRRRRLIVDDKQARTVADTLIAAHRIGYLSNTQVRYWQHPDEPMPRPYLLEVNTRISGGLFQTALAGVNLPWAAVRMATGRGADLPRPIYDVAYAMVDTLVPLL
ncbi:MAG: ATP-grasp domain-containing protein [Mycobacteriales bacterium]